MQLHAYARHHAAQVTCRGRAVGSCGPPRPPPQTIEEGFRGTFDFFYLPIDFKNKCNVGYAFINMTAPRHILPLVERFDGRRWDRFNSEKVRAHARATRAPCRHMRTPARHAGAMRLLRRGHAVAKRRPCGCHARAVQAACRRHAGAMRARLGAAGLRAGLALGQLRPG